MMLTGTLIEDLIATVERAQQRAQAEEMLEIEIEPWLAAMQDDASCEPKLLGVA